MTIIATEAASMVTGADRPSATMATGTTTVAGIRIATAIATIGNKAVEHEAASAQPADNPYLPVAGSHTVR